MTPVNPYLRSTENVYLRIALDLDRAATTQDTHEIRIVNFHDGDKFVHFVRFLTVRSIMGTGFTLEQHALGAVDWLEALSR